MDGRRYRLLDLTADQAERVEDAIGLPLDKWGDAPKARLFRLVLAELDGVDPESLRGVPVRDLAARIEPEAEQDPKPLGESSSPS